MLPNLNDFSLAKLGRLAAAVVLGAALVACGGGGGSPGGSGAVVGGGGTPATKDPVIKLAIVDGSGNPVTTLSGGQNATVKASVSTATGVPAAGAVVQFVASDTTLLQFSPVSGSALTDAAGVAVITIKPGSFTASGALTINATAVVESKTATASANIAVGAAPLTVGTLSFSPAPSGPLPAFSTLALNIPVSSGGQPVTTVDGLTMSSLCVGDGSATLVRGSIANGVQLATYTNNGCLRGTDVITVSIGNSTQTISVGVSPANIGTIQFVGSNLSGSSIVLKGSGGLGRSEAAQLTFRVVDQHNNGLGGVDVNFTATTYTGGLAVSPTKATTDLNGNVSTMVSSGTIPTPVRVVAEATRNGVTISGLSDTLTVSTGLPIQRFMSMSTDSANIEGLEYDNTTASVTVLLADQYGNQVSDGTAINFVTEGGAIGSSAQGACTTIGGGCTVTLRSQNFRPLNGRVTVLAYLQGIENFVDANGDGQYSCTNFVDANGAVPSNYRPLVDTCVSGGEAFTDMGDPFLDAGSLAKTSGVATGGTLDGGYDAANGDLPFPYNHSTYSSTGNGKWGLNYIRSSFEMIFSGSTPTLVRQACDPLGNCRDWVAADGDPSVITGLSGASCAVQMLTFRLFDVNNNPLPKDTALSAVDADKISALTFSPDKVPSTNLIGGTIHHVNIKPSDKCESGVLSVKVTTPKGTSTLFPFKTN
jgi:hypothetical protein